MVGKTLFTDQQVREIKTNLVIGVPCSALARHWGCGEETIGRIKRGLTYRHVRVLGEEKLRPGVAVVEMAPEALTIQSGITDEQIDLMAKEAVRKQEAQKAAEKAVGEVDPEFEAKLNALKGIKSFMDDIPTDRILD